MPENRGFYKKYEVRRIDFKPGREDSQYFVLDVTHDPYAIPALQAYRDALPEDWHALRNDLDRLIAGQRFNHDTGEWTVADHAAERLREFEEARKPQE